MVSYICLGSNDLERSARFYDPVLGALGVARCEVGDEEASEDWSGLGWGLYADHGRTQLALWLCRPYDRRAATPGNGVMVALTAPSWAAVERFHAAALAHGGRCEGAPGLRPGYNPDFFAAYVRDPDGNKLAAVCRGFRERPPGG